MECPRLRGCSLPGPPAQQLASPPELVLPQLVLPRLVLPRLVLPRLALPLASLLWLRSFEGMVCFPFQSILL